MEFLSFTKRERAGILSLVSLLLLVAIAPRLLPRKPPVLLDIAGDQTAIPAGNPERIGNRPRDALEGLNGRAWTDAPEKERPYSKAYERFFPNDGSGRKNNRGPEKYHAVHTLKSDRPPGEASVFTAGNKSYQVKRQHGDNFLTGRTAIDINTADTTAFIALPGIGSRLAARIILFRQKLGGFYSVSQISEVYGLPDSVYRMIRPRLTCAAGKVKKLCINTAAGEELQRHPYIRWKMAQALVAYRDQHGHFGSLEELQQVHNIDSLALLKMWPYLAVENSFGQ